MIIKDYKKFIRANILIFIIVLGISLSINHKSYSFNSKKYISIYVVNGDTLWSIACNLQNTEYYDGKDVRYIINDLREINNLKNCNLSIGDKLIIPTI